MRVFLLCLAFSSLSSHAYACRIQKPYYNAPNALITHSENIYLVEAYEKSILINVSTGTITSQKTIPQIRFYIIEVLKGKDAELAPVHVYDEEKWRATDYGKTDFNAHADEAFWAETGGRMTPFTYGHGLCGPQHTFYDGARYLLFPDQLLSMKSAELVKSEDDAWLAYVRAQLSQK